VHTHLSRDVVDELQILFHVLHVLLLRGYLVACVHTLTLTRTHTRADAPRQCTHTHTHTLALTRSLTHIHSHTHTRAVTHTR